MLLLALDTATPAVTVALHDGRHLLAEETMLNRRRHGELLAAAIGRVLAAGGATGADLGVVAVGTGPGPYTGLRAGLVTARVLGSALGIPVYGLCTLDVIARAAASAAAGREFIVATDARRKEVYWAHYSGAGQRIGDPAVSDPATVSGPGPVAGEGAVLYPALGEPIPPRYPAAASLAEMVCGRIAAGLPPGSAEPLYLRRPDARVPGKPKRVTP